MFVVILVAAFLAGIALVVLLLVLNLTVAVGTLYTIIVVAHNSILLAFLQPLKLYNSVHSVAES